MKQRIYIDTSVVGGFFDDEFKDASQRLFKRLEENEVRFVISDLLELELILAPKHVSELLLNYPTDRFERVELTDEIMLLADQYIAAKVVGRTSIQDFRKFKTRLPNDRNPDTARTDKLWRLKKK